MTQNQALNILKTGANVFLTGEPGSGKTYVINRYVEYLRSHNIQPAITASTGIAATHIGGMTIHSWSGIGIKDKLSNSELRAIATNDYVQKRINKAKILIIDEISMLPPETLQMIDAICKKIKGNLQPFGGVQVVLVGDFFQLPPVNKKIINENSQENLFDESSPRFAYDSEAWKQAKFVNCYISEQYRQDDSQLLLLLSKIRTNSFDESSLNIIKQRKIDLAKIPLGAPKLYSHNIDVDFVNNQMLAKIPSKARLFLMIAHGHEAIINTMKRGCLSPEKLYLKIGASVMFTKNNSKEGFVNGTLGIVEGFDKDSGLPIVKIRNGRKIKVMPADWTIEEGEKIKGMLRQIPLRLAWAITVHKSQGISLDEAVIDLSKVFEFGQGYVALSRVRRLTGINLLGWNDMAFQVDPQVIKKDQEFSDYSIDAEKEFSNFDDQITNKTQEGFILSCGGEINVVDVMSKNKKSKQSTYDETLKLWDEGKNIADISSVRNLNNRTILNHIENLVSKGKINKKDLLRIFPANMIGDLFKIKTVFKKIGIVKLSPVYEYFNGKYSYDDLKLVRMMIE